ncbi:MAG TPA: PAS domain S-box protein, partial [Candidatus Sulfotelmatobacter sp.]|nr:PAS domain S-box protein [Candidatus Sulfotelmatobacter sp.]
MSTREAWARYALAAGLGILAVGLKGVVDAGLGSSTGYLSYVGAVILAAWVGGLGGGLVATLVSAAAQAVVFEIPGTTPITLADGVRIGWFVADGVLLSVVASGLRRASVAQQAARREVVDLLGTVSRFKSTVDASLEAIFMFDPQSLRVTYANRGAADLLGADPEAIAGRRLTDIQPVIQEDALREELRPLAERTTDAVRYTSVLERDDGRHVPFEALVQQVHLPGESNVLVLSARDISERIEVQARLARVAGDERRQAAELRAVLQAMGNAVLVVAHRGDVRLANEAAKVLLGKVPAAFVEVPTLLGVAEDDLPPLDAPAPPRVIHSGDGRWLEVSAYLADVGGTAGPGHSTIMIMRDVTAAREAEQAREAFIGVLSHELRTPVTTIYGYAKVLQRPSRGKAPPAEMLADIEIEADRLYRIVEDLLALSRVEGGISVAGEPLLIQHLAEPLVQSEQQRWPQIRYELDVP